MMSRFACVSKPTYLRSKLLLCRAGGGSFHFCYFAKKIGFPADAFQMWIPFAAVIVNPVSLKKIFVLDEQLNRRSPVLYLPDCRAKIVRSPSPPIDREQLHPRRDSRLSRHRAGNHIDHLVAVVAACVAYQRSERELHIR